MGSLTPLVILVLLGCATTAAIAADCTLNTQNFIRTSDIMSASNIIAMNSFNPPLADPLGFQPTQTETLTFTGTTFCIRNDFVFESTHIKLSDITFGANDIINQCCTADICQGGRFTITGDTGLTVLLLVQPAGTSC
ncbi:unnamed protein product [Calypogeia fissa]